MYERTTEALQFKWRRNYCRSTERLTDLSWRFSLVYVPYERHHHLYTFNGHNDRFSEDAIVSQNWTKTYNNEVAIFTHFEHILLGL